MANRMIAHRKPALLRKRPKPVHGPKIFGTISWIANELVGIRTVEQHLHKKLSSGTSADKQILLNQIRDLNVRVQVLDRALDNYVSQGRWT